MGIEEKAVGVYILHNPNTDETYAGSGVLEDRRASHFYYLQAGKEGKRGKDGRLISHHNRKLQAAYDKDPNFDFIGIPTETREEAIAEEQSLIDEFKDNPLLLNLSTDARAGAYKHTPEQRAARSARMMGNQNSVGYVQTDEHKAKIGQSLKGRVVTPETREKLSEVLTGRKASEEHIRNNSLARIGKPLSPEIRAKMAQGQKGRKHSEETKLKMSISQQARADARKKEQDS